MAEQMPVQISKSQPVSVLSGWASTTSHHQVAHNPYQTCMLGVPPTKKVTSAICMQNKQDSPMSGQGPSQCSGEQSSPVWDVEG